MSKKFLFFFIFLALPMVSVAGIPNDQKNDIVTYKYDAAVQDVLTKIPLPSDLTPGIERAYLSAQTEYKNGNIKEAIRLYRKALDEKPDFVRARFELALCYMADGQWDRADYYLRLAMAAENLPDDVKKVMESYRYLVRQNKNWDSWFEYGDVPNSRVSLANNNGGCLSGDSGVCEQVTDLKKGSGVNFVAGGDYEFKLSDNWRWKNDAALYTNLYEKDRYDDLYLSGSTGPRYVWDKGDIWIAGVLSRSWYGHKRLNWSYGAKIDTNYDWTRRLSSGLILIFTNNIYDEYDDLMNGQTYTMIPSVTYSIDSTKYILLLGELERETAELDSFSNYKYGAGLGFGTELPRGFYVYLESYFTLVNYDAGIDVNGTQHIKERDFLQKYTVSLSNIKIEYMGFIPVVNVSYTNKESNISMPKYDRWSFGLSVKRKF